MAVTYGFYNSLNGDRRYNATHLSTLFDGIIQDGVFQTIGNTFAVTPSASGLAVIVDTGKAWFKNTWTINNTKLVLSLGNAVTTSGRSRIDAIVLDIDKRKDKRMNDIIVVNGTASTTPRKPVLTNVSEVGEEGPHFQIPLAWVKTGYQDTVVNAANIENNVGIVYDEIDEDDVNRLVSCPFVLGAMQAVNIRQFTQQLEASFNNWFDNFQSNLNGDVAANLQSQMNSMIKAGPSAITDASEMGDAVLYCQYE